MTISKNKPLRIGVMSLGCSKNQVDAERMMRQFTDAGWQLCGELSECDAVLVNTCGFIEDAKKESIEAILEACAEKENGRVRCVAVTGCLAERYRQELADEIPETDVVLGIGCNEQIVSAVQAALEGERTVAFGEKDALALEGERVLASPPYTAYVKVAEGCDNRCSYCAIPLIRGNFRSRPVESIVEECRTLAAKGVTELNLVAQDTSRYGEDLYGESRLPELIDRVCEIDGVHWVRILYCYPDHITDALIDTIARQPKVCKYIDIPVQHASEKVLREMNRTGSRESLLALVNRLRERIPGVVLRTTVIAGFPGETDEDFTELCLLVQQAGFERLGCFAYSQEEDTPAGERPDQIDPALRQRRADTVMELQMNQAFEFAASMVGRTLEVLVEGQEEDGLWVGRSYMDAPDIDTRVYFTTDRELSPGEYLPVQIDQAQEYDLLGHLKEE